MPLHFDPPLLNSATPWATTREDIRALYNCPYTGALTIRTCRIDGYPHDNKVHQYCFTDSEHTIIDQSDNQVQATMAFGGADCITSLNTLGYSPIPLAEYLEIVRDMLSEEHATRKKPIIFSVTGTVPQVRSCYAQISRLGADTRSRLLMEINLSCPNIVGKPPPAYSEEQLVAYLQAIAAEAREAQRPEKGDDLHAGNRTPLPEIGVKVPPYTYRDQALTLMSALRAVMPCPVTFITAINTLGSSLLLSDSFEPALNSEAGTGIGGLAGAALHPLALGNVRILRSLLDEHEQLKHISVIGVGGVFDRGGYERMRAVGAEAVAVGTALGSEGLGVFSKIVNDVERADKDLEAALHQESPNPIKRVCLDNDPLTDYNAFSQTHSSELAA